MDEELLATLPAGDLEPPQDRAATEHEERQQKAHGIVANAQKGLQNIPNWQTKQRGGNMLHSVFNCGLWGSRRKVLHKGRPLLLLQSS